MVAALVLFSVPDQQAALAEISRVLRPGGRLRFRFPDTPLPMPTSPHVSGEAVAA